MAHHQARGSPSAGMRENTRKKTSAKGMFGSLGGEDVGGKHTVVAYIKKKERSSGTDFFLKGPMCDVRVVHRNKLQEHASTPSRSWTAGKQEAGQHAEGMMSLDEQSKNPRFPAERRTELLNRLGISTDLDSSEHLFSIFAKFSRILGYVVHECY